MAGWGSGRGLPNPNARDLGPFHLPCAKYGRSILRAAAGRNDPPRTRRFPSLRFMYSSPRFPLTAPVARLRPEGFRARSRSSIAVLHKTSAFLGRRERAVGAAALPRGKVAAAARPDACCHRWVKDELCGCWSVLPGAHTLAQMDFLRDRSACRAVAAGPAPGVGAVRHPAPLSVFPQAFYDYTRVLAKFQVLSPESDERKRKMAGGGGWRPSPPAPLPRRARGRRFLNRGVCLSTPTLLSLPGAEGKERARGLSPSSFLSSRQGEGGRGEEGKTPFHR